MLNTTYMSMVRKGRGKKDEKEETHQCDILAERRARPPDGGCSIKEKKSTYTLCCRQRMITAFCAMSPARLYGALGTMVSWPSAVNMRLFLDVAHHCLQILSYRQSKWSERLHTGADTTMISWPTLTTALTVSRTYGMHSQPW